MLYPCYKYLPLTQKTDISYAIRDRLIERWMNTMRSYYACDTKRMYYLSLEFLIGQTLLNAMLNLSIDQECCQIMKELGHDLQKQTELEPDAALDNRGLGRLAACFLDSLATMQLPGYGIRYEYGMFR